MLPVFFVIKKGIDTYKSDFKLLVIGMWLKIYKF